MRAKIKAPISVICFYNHKKKLFYPAKIYWEGNEFRISNIGYYHSYYEGKSLVHVYSVISKDQFFKILFNTKKLSWELTEIDDNVS